jgi:hypothetical protein
MSQYIFKNWLKKTKLHGRSLQAIWLCFSYLNGKSGRDYKTHVTLTAPSSLQSVKWKDGHEWW